MDRAASYRGTLVQGEGRASGSVVETPYGYEYQGKSSGESMSTPIYGEAESWLVYRMPINHAGKGDGEDEGEAAPRYKP